MKCVHFERRLAAQKEREQREAAGGWREVSPPRYERPVMYGRVVEAGFPKTLFQRIKELFERY